MITRTKVVTSLKEALEVAKCDHKFENVREHDRGGGLSATCPKCKCTMSVWPGTIHYEEIVAARDAQKKETG